MFKNFHPFTLFMYFLYVVLGSVITFNPVYLVPAFIGAVLFLVEINTKNTLKTLLLYLAVIVAVSLTNPLFSHNGATVLFFVNDSRITLEAFIYGLTASLMITGVLVWFNCFNKVFDSEKLIYLIGRFFPKLALVFSMTLNFIPRMIREFKSINNAQKSIKQNRVKRYIQAFSAVITRGMEGAIVTSDSMNARGYTLKGRTSFHRFVFTLSDAVYLTVFSVLFALGMIFERGVSYYPYFVINLSVSGIIGTASFTILALLPFALEVKEALEWRFYLSKI